MEIVEDRDRVSRRIGEVLSGFDDVELGYVYGSFPREEEFNDVDVAVLLLGSPSPYVAMKHAMQIARRLEKEFEYQFEFDVRALNSAPNHSQYQVIKTGFPVFTRDEETRIEYEAHTITTYQDYKPTHEWFNKQLLTRP